ncbi:MAG: 8-oxo-dGTP diphosphatase, partial [Anaerolineae bacterium]|nr:8-oxo-dGTP diphosphatase [Anaerolineae bacterium]
AMTSAFRLTTLIYALRDGQVLMLYRHKEPNLGLWVAPGGKIHDDESPRECAIRELREETGLEAVNPELRAIVTEISPRKDWLWLMFVYRTQVAPGAVQGDDREGRLRWFPVEEVPHLPIPQADAIFYPFVIDPVGPPVELKFIYDADLRLVSWTHAPIGGC